MSIAPASARIHLPRLANPPATVLEFLCGHFAHIGRDAWLSRIARGEVVSDSGATISSTTPYQPGETVLYRREVESEIVIPFAEAILYEDDRLVVADKPHFLPVTPSGGAVNECLLSRLQSKTGNNGLAPLHRLDRDTAGLVIFAKQKADRAAYTQLFAEGKVERTYCAVAKISNDVREGQEWLVETRIEAEPGSFRMRSVPGEVNARTQIRVTRVGDGLARFELQPSTGKKHQLRIHMMSVGFPILNDPFYPELRPAAAGDYSRPLQLLANGLSFQDPITKAAMCFESMQRLAAG